MQPDGHHFFSKFAVTVGKGKSVCSYPGEWSVTLARPDGLVVWIVSSGIGTLVQGQDHRMPMVKMGHRQERRLSLQVDDGSNKITATNHTTNIIGTHVICRPTQQ